MKIALIAPAILCGLLLSAPAVAHHGYAAFDTSAPVTFHGIATDFHFVNPHCVLEFDVPNEKGQVQNWRAEMTSANHLAPRGWTEASIQPGDKISITGYRAKNGSPSIWVTRIVLADGQDLKMDTSN